MKCLRVALGAVVSMSSVACLFAANSAPPAREQVTSLVNREFPSLHSLYQNWHQHPELSFHEEKTSADMAAELRRAGFQVTTNFGGFGVVGVLQNGAGPTLLVRTDLDALPVKEQTGLPYASNVQTKDDAGNDVSVMHACGHDIHMTVFVGAARLVSQLKDRWQGTLVFIGQPAEERVGGARAMLGEGLFKRFPKPDFCLALHVKPDIAAGTVGYTEGFALANVDSVDITFRGIGGHGSAPHKTKDPVVLAAEAILAFQTIVSREVEPGEAAVVTVGSIHGGTKRNIIPDEVKLALTVRSYSESVRSNTLAAITRIARGLAMTAGLPEDKMPLVTTTEESVPATYNDPDLTRRVATVFQNWLGAERVTKVKAIMGAEDFSLFGRTPEKIPICMFWLGASDPQRVAESQRTGVPLPFLHSSLFAPVPEPTIKTGIAAMTAAILELAPKK
ncbi:MAG: amidohydrolase [Verrucomicrobia bacterium]|nr:amidohydrolase [Verrucomicrobiota bacterium]